MNKRLISLILVSVLIFGLLVVGVADDEDGNGDTADIEWEIEGCDISITASDVDFGKVSISVPGSIDTESGGYTGQPEVEVESTCSYTLSVSVEADSFDLPDDHPESAAIAITDFAVKGGDIGSYNSFDGLGSDHSKPVEDAGTVGTTTFQMDYQYTFDYKDVAGDYKVVLTYTASS